MRRMPATAESTGIWSSFKRSDATLPPSNGVVKPELPTAIVRGRTVRLSGRKIRQASDLADVAGVTLGVARISHQPLITIQRSQNFMGREMGPQIVLRTPGKFHGALAGCLKCRQCVGQRPESRVWLEGFGRAVHATGHECLADLLFAVASLVVGLRLGG